MIQRLSVHLIIGLALLGCNPTKQSQSINQGVEGTLIWLEGNQMPSTDKGSVRSGSPIQRTVLIYELTHRSQAILEDQLYSAISTKLAAKIESDSIGNFESYLPAGQYSVFTKEAKGFFANRFDGDGNINPITITEGKVTPLDIKVDYLAFY